MISVRPIDKLICLVFRNMPFPGLRLCRRLTKTSTERKAEGFPQCAAAEPPDRTQTIDRGSSKSLRMQGARHLFQTIDEPWAGTRKQVAVDFVDAAIQNCRRVFERADDG